MEHAQTIGALCGGRLAKAKGVRYGPSSTSTGDVTRYAASDSDSVPRHAREARVLNFSLSVKVARSEKKCGKN